MITTDLELASNNGPRYWKTVTLPHNTRTEVCLTITDLKGRIVDLASRDAVKQDDCDDCDDAVFDNPGFEDGVEPKDPMWPDVNIRMRAVPAYNAPAIFDLKGTIVDPDQGKVVFHIDHRHTSCIGVFLAEVALFRGDLNMDSWKLYVMVEPSVFGVGYTGDGMITIPEVRLALNDEMPSDNYLLDACEFRDAQILAAIRYPIDLWNSLLPFDPGYRFNLQNFPYRYPWLRCATGHLLEMAAHSYRRNDLPTSAGGVTVRDKAKAPEYEAKGKELILEFRQWAQDFKASMSVRDCWGTISSGYRSGR